MDTSIPPLSQVILKVASRCNLNCSYCYVYHKADTSWQARPALMPEAVFETALARIRRHCERSGQQDIRLTFHGGEPCLLGVRTFDEWCRRIRRALDNLSRIDLSIQTNATLID